jgi:hypothetical protein
MIYLFYTAVCMVLIVVQTTVLANAFFYDLLIPFVVYLGLFRSARESLPVIIVLGFAMDNLSGAPFGLYLTVYLWSWVGIKWLMRYLHIRTSALVFSVVPLAVCLEALISITVLAMQTSPITDGMGGRIAWQLFWALITGPPFLVFYETARGRIEKWAAERKAERDGLA